MVDVSTNDNTIGINVSSAGQKSSIGFVTPQSYYDGLAEQWAISESLVNNEDYSSKHYAEESKKQALISTSKATIATEKAQEVVTHANEALADITDQEETSKNAVKAEGDTQVARVQAEGANYATKAEATYTAGTGISIENNVISNTQTSAEWGGISGTLSNQSDLQSVLNAKQDTLVSGTNIKTINSNSILGSGNLDINGLPSQSGQSGKYLTTDGSNASWGNISTTLSGLSDVTLTTLSDEQILKYSSTSSKWVNVDLVDTQVIINTYTNGTSGYRIWSDGYCEQWGVTGKTTSTTVTFLKQFADTSYNIQITGFNYTSSANDYSIAKTWTPSNMVIIGSANIAQSWKVCGYLAEGEY